MARVSELDDGTGATARHRRKHKDDVSNNEKSTSKRDGKKQRLGWWLIEDVADRWEGNTTTTSGAKGNRTSGGATLKRQGEMKQ
ncbi:hypothetical protein V6N11_019158 [Hibiscus sabdariffa]|uniref:Uncharacterized protein n=1 Tax=Hibiscus sabdariffa TaxID=183260 RepID=A0ABR2R1J7_9ROSI